MANTTSPLTSSCPCCSFYPEELPDDLFLPDSLKNCGDDGTAAGNEEAMHVITPGEALRELNAFRCRPGVTLSNRQSLLLDTHCHAHLEREEQDIYDPGESSEEEAPPVVLSLTCAVEETDWEATVQLASSSNVILPAFGIHPWYLEGLSDNYLEKLEALLMEHPRALVGEIGLCKMARFLRTYEHGKAAALDLQRKVFVDQLLLAARLHRPVSVHCVNQHGVFLKTLRELKNEGKELPHLIGMHSFTGTAHHVEQLLKFEKEISPTKPLFYFGFSHSINHVMCTSEKAKRQGRQAVRAVPLDRLLVESDVHASRDVAAGTAGAIAYVAACLGRPLLSVAKLTSENGIRFLTSGASDE